LSPEEKDLLVASEAHVQGTVVAQIFSGIFFSGVAGWLTVSNGTKLAFVQKAALEKRLTVCCFFSTYVSFFSAFFNFFQLTPVDDVLLEASGNFTLDLARPIEWIMTCPLMQLSLVIMGGAKLPEYRRFLMPGFSFTILNLGVVGAFFGDKIFAIKITAFLLSCALFVAMVYFNRLQIVEYSNGQEGLITGDSEYRKATILLIATWAPFPIWYFVSPEGLNLIDNVLVIQLGWAFLNIVAKFSFIFYIQRVKDMYCNRLKTKRELQPDKKVGGHRGGSASPPGEMDFSGAASPGLMSLAEYERQESDRKKAQLAAVVVETMNFLGMAQHTERFTALLERSNMQSIFDVEVLDHERCQELQLPWELVSALQRRLKVWKLEMVDDAEAGLDKGEEYWIRKGMDAPDMDPGDGSQHAMAPYMMPGMMPMPYEHAEEQSAKLAEIEELLRQKLKSEENVIQESRSKSELVDKSVDGLAAKFMAAMEALEQRLVAKLDNVAVGNAAGFADTSSRDALPASMATQRTEVRAFESRITAKLDELQTVGEQQRRRELQTLESRINNNLEQQVSILMTKLDACSQRVEAHGQKTDSCIQKVEAVGAEQAIKISEVVSKLAEKLDETSRSSRAGLDALLVDVSAGLAQLGSQSTNILQKTEAQTAQMRTGFDITVQKAEAVLASQTKLFAASEDGWRTRLNELETNLVCREDELEATLKKRHEELVRMSPVRKVDEILAEVGRIGDRTDQAIDSLGLTLTTEVKAVGKGLASKTETAQGTIIRQLAELESGSQRRIEENSAKLQQTAEDLATRFDAVDAAIQRRAEATAESARQSAQGTEAAMKKALESLATSTQLSTEKAFGKAAAGLEALEESLPKRLEEAIAKCAGDSAQHGASAAERRAEKAIEALGMMQRGDIQAATTNILEGINDITSVQTRKAAEREDRSQRKLEELLEVASTRTMQKTEDVGTDMKKELHGFAKRLNSKIPFM